VLQTYKSGVISAAGCSSNNQNHAVQLVGVDLSNNYFKVRNSWGPAWGESGYFRVETRTGKELNACNIVGYVCPAGYTCTTGTLPYCTV
jgi:C1A family cysteine protease